MSDVRPSDIRGIIIPGALGNTMAEVVAMLITGYLAAHGDDWNTEFSWTEFAQWVDNNAAEDVSMFGPRVLINPIHWLIGQYLITRRDSDDNTYFKMNTELADLVQHFAMRRMANTPPCV